MKEVLTNIEPAEPVEKQLKRLRYRSGHRGCKETDLVLGRFAEAKLDGLQGEELAAYASLLDEDDVLIWDWLLENSEPPPEYRSILQQLRALTPVSK